jgi:hypothetical protein
MSGISDHTLVGGGLAFEKAAEQGAMIARLRAAIVAVAPIVLLGAFVAHPYIGLGPPNEAAVAKAAAANTFRWGIAHILAGIASGLMLLAFLAIRSYLREAGENRWSALAVPFVAVGATLYAIPPGMEFAALAAAETGADIEAAQSAVQPWFLAVFLGSGIASAIGAFCFAKALSAVRRMDVTVPAISVIALGGVAVTRLVPLIGVQFYVHAAVTLVALLPLAYVMWRHPIAAADTRTHES